MATRILVKRKKSSDYNAEHKKETSMTVSPGELYYNLSDKVLYVGNSEDEKIQDKKHLSEITVTETEESSKTNISFYVGENNTNKYEKNLDDVLVGKSRDVTEKIAGTDISDIFESDGKTVINASNVTESIAGTPINDIFSLNEDGSISSKVSTAQQADSATRLSSGTVGSNTKPVFFENGIPKAVSSTFLTKVPLADNNSVGGVKIGYKGQVVIEGLRYAVELDNSGFAYVKIPEASDVDLSNYTTKDYVDNVIKETKTFDTVTFNKETKELVFMLEGIQVASCILDIDSGSNLTWKTF